MFALRQGLTPGRPRYWSSGGQAYRYLQLSNIQDGRLDVSGASKEERLNPRVAEPHVPQPGALIVSLRTRGLPLVLVEREEPDHVLSNNLVMMTLLPEHRGQVQPEFVALLLQSQGMKERLEPLYTGVHTVSMPLRLFRQVTVGIPPYWVQNALVDTWRKARREQKLAREREHLVQKALDTHLVPYSRPGLGRPSRAEEES